MGKLFGTNGVRGIFGEDFNLEFIHDLVLSVGTYFKQGKILVAYDGRNSSHIIAKVVSSALNFSGLDCFMAGLIPTPCLEFAIKKLGYDGGIMITASHNPPEYNGIKVIAYDGVEISRNDEKKIENIFFENNWNVSSKIGSTCTEQNTIKAYINGIKSHLDLSSIKDKRFKVSLDLGNGAQAVAVIRLCKELGCNVYSINEKIDGNFPGRGSEPTPENLQSLSELVKSTNSDLGIAFDGDGDRSIFCDNEGKIITGDSSAILLCNYLLRKNPNSKVVTCLNSGTIIEKEVLDTNSLTNQNSKVIRTKVGSVEVSRKMVDENALIGFEENGGFMFGVHNQVRDGAMTLGLMLELLSKCPSSTFAKEIKKLPQSFTTKTKIKCTKDESKRIIEHLSRQFPHSDTTDGIKIIIDKKNWIMVRPSGTEPIIRIYAESDSQKNLDDLISKYLEKIKSILVRQHF
jgi:phosphomannomutase/phosphoglucomutase|tara:strand:- start:6060 stop:7436 length:1377 start_codon:yes stop_codon:yes gene_type:complete